MAQKNPTGAEGCYATSMLRESHGAVNRKTVHRSQSKIPNAESLEAIRQARTGEGLVSFDSIEEMLADLNDD